MISSANSSSSAEGFGPLLRTSLMSSTSSQSPPRQPRVRQSLSVLQCLPTEHCPHGPPQSASLSPPFVTPSEHVGARQVPPSHTSLEQSASISQGPPGGQPSQEPPQSTPVSSPSWRRFVQ